MDLEFKADSIGVRSYDKWQTVVELSGVTEEDVLEHFSVEDIISYFGEDAILDRIDEKKVRDFYGIEDEE